MTQTLTGAVATVRLQGLILIYLAVTSKSSPKGGDFMEKDNIVKGGCGHEADEIVFSASVVAGVFLLGMIALIAAVIS